MGCDMGNTSAMSQVVFLLGAGASVKAGVPDTFRFVEEFRQSVVNNEDSKTIDKIIETLKAWHGSDIDVELLLETLTKLDTKDQEPLLRFFTGGTFILSGYPEKRPIIEDLKDFIKRKAIIESQEKIRYLEPLLGFVEEHKPLNIFSVNYDTCIEQFCNVHQLNYQDGFDVNWNPQVFERENVDIRLYKLHGSIIWYKSDRAGYIKLPVMTREASIELITGEKAESLMLYPMQKFDYAEPLLELLVRLRNVIQSCKVLIVVGYSFRDAHIKRVLLDVARKNTGLTLILVDPKASYIYLEKLKYYDPSYSQIRSSLDGKVVCLPYKFEEVLPNLKDHYLSNLQSGLSQYFTCMSGERRGTKVDWVGCLKPLVNAEHTEKVQLLLESKIRDSDIGNHWQLKVELLMKMSMNLAANNQQAYAEKYLADLKDLLHSILIDRLDIDVSREHPDKVGITFLFRRRDGSGSSYDDIETLKSFMREQYEYLVSRSKMTTDNIFIQEFKFIENIIKYLESFRSNRITFEEFASLHKPYIKDADSLRANMLGWIKGDVPELRDTFPKQLLALGKQAMQGLLA
jgi:NAD-dependent SIR2 family protein deacetylase